MMSRRKLLFSGRGQQVISGPVLNIPVLIFPSKKDADPYKSIFHIMPETLSVNGDIQTEKRHRSIYQAVYIQPLSVFQVILSYLN